MDARRSTEAHRPLYPPVEITAEMARERPDLKPLVGQKLTVIAWLWARTVKSPNPAFSHVDVPLVSTFILSSKEGKEVYVQPVVDGDRYRFTVKVGTPPPDAQQRHEAGARRKFRCLVSGTPIAARLHQGRSAKQGGWERASWPLLPKASARRVYLSPTAEHGSYRAEAVPAWKPDVEMSGSTHWFSRKPLWYDKFRRPLHRSAAGGLTTFSDLWQKRGETIRHDALAAGMADDDKGLEAGGSGATAYAEAVSVYLAFVVDRMRDFYEFALRLVIERQRNVVQAILATSHADDMGLCRRPIRSLKSSRDLSDQPQSAVASCIEILSPRIA